MTTRDTRWVEHARKYIDESRVCLAFVEPTLSDVIDRDKPLQFASSEHNVALWMLGFAIELAYKAVVASEGTAPATSHSLKKISASAPRSTRRRIEKAIDKGLQFRGRGLRPSILWDYIDGEIGYESRRYWNVTASGEFRETHFGSVIRGEDPYRIVADDVYGATTILLGMAEDTLGTIGESTQTIKMEFMSPPGKVEPGTIMMATGVSVPPPQLCDEHEPPGVLDLPYHGHCVFDECEARPAGTFTFTIPGHTSSFDVAVCEPHQEQLESEGPGEHEV